jgi:hypothetical protein
MKGSKRRRFDARDDTGSGWRLHRENGRRITGVGCDNGKTQPGHRHEDVPIKSVNGKRHLSLSDDMAWSAGAPMQEVSFCVSGEPSNFCGNAKIARTRRGATSSDIETIKRFVQQIALTSACAR